MSLFDEVLGRGRSWAGVASNHGFGLDHGSRGGVVGVEGGVVVEVVEAGGIRAVRCGWKVEGVGVGVVVVVVDRGREVIE